MTTTELLAIFRAEVFDEALPYLWSDALIYGYIDDAQKQFCRDTYGIADSRSFKLNLVAGTEWYKLDPKILKIRDAIDPATGKDIPIVAVEKMAENNMRFAPPYTAPQLAALLATSAANLLADPNWTAPVEALITGMDDGMVRTLTVPKGPSVIELRTFRLPVTVEAGDDLEIPEQHHRHLLNWVKHLAYDVQDTETYNKGASESYKDKHEAYCAKAKVEQSRARRPVSTVTYGGI